MLKAAVLSLLLITSSAFACSHASGVRSFVPDKTNFHPKFENNRIALLPAPKVVVTKVTRGTSAPGALCSDAGTVSLQLTWPTTSQYTLSEVGFYFRVVSGKQPDLIFPLGPVTSEVKENSTEFSFEWLDGNPSKQEPLNLDVEVFAVNNGLQIGPSTRFHLADAPG